MVIDFQESLLFYSIPPLLFLNYLLEFKKDRLQISPFTFFFQGILITLFFLSTILSLNPGSSYYYLLSFITIILVVNLANIYIVDLDQFLSVTVFISIIYSIALIASKLGLIILAPKGLGDNFILQVWGHSYLGNFLLLPIAICFHRLRHKSRLHYVVLLILFIATLFLSQSRSGVIGAIVAILLTPTTVSTQKWIKTLSVIVFTTILGFLIIFSSSSAASYKSADGGRPIFWRQAISGIRRSPIFGNGPATFNLINRQFKKPSEDITNTPHNSVLELLTNHGIIFTSIFLLYIVWGLKNQRKSQPLLFSIGVGLFISSLLDSFLSFPGFIIILLIATSYRHPHFYSFSKTNHLPSTLTLGTISLLIFGWTLIKTSSDIAYWCKNYSLSVKLDPFNLNSLLQIHDKETIKKMIRLFPREESALFSAIEYTRLPENIPLYNRLFESYPQTNPIHYYQLGQYFLDVHKYNDLDQLLKEFDYQFLEKKDSLPQLDIAKLYYYLSISKWRENKPQEAIELAKKSIYYSNGWSHFHIELANLYWYTSQKDLAVSQLTTLCHLYPPSIHDCENYLNDNKTKFLTPGSPGYFNSIEKLGE